MGSNRKRTTQLVSVAFTQAGPGSGNRISGVTSTPSVPRRTCRLSGLSAAGATACTLEHGHGPAVVLLACLRARPGPGSLRGIGLRLRIGARRCLTDSERASCWPPLPYVGPSAGLSALWHGSTASAQYGNFQDVSVTDGTAGRLEWSRIRVSEPMNSEANAQSARLSLH